MPLFIWRNLRNENNALPWLDFKLNDNINWWNISTGNNILFKRVGKCG